MSEERDSVVRQRFDLYRDGFARGEADPDPVMAGLDEESRDRLGEMIDEFLATGPRPDPALFGPETPRVAEMADSIVMRLDSRAGALSRLLVERRAEMELSQTDMVRAIARSVDASPGETEKIDAYYHDLEWGSLPAAGLTTKLIAIVAKTLSLTSDTLIEAGRALGPGRASSSGPVYARTIEPDDSALGMASPGGPENVAAGVARRAAPPDRIDQLFTGG